ncbi:hypothetical protein DIURU_004189 [Diutina rugosa]|uniref:Uncharacterized protein n=1 Tax=Diutina rugosa TaxID=5481 RepID=A0A642UIK1_DIURU|nr:uncharacterized protein DIURU_004189 [Diutina rugosa]KAA8899706.1 hypothetical protein DIURU_004189 [Diutina rugosa]
MMIYGQEKFESVDLVPGRLLAPWIRVFYDVFGELHPVVPLSLANEIESFEIDKRITTKRSYNYVLGLLVAAFSMAKLGHFVIDAHDEAGGVPEYAIPHPYSGNMQMMSQPIQAVANNNLEYLMADYMEPLTFEAYIDTVSSPLVPPLVVPPLHGLTPEFLVSKAQKLQAVNYHHTRVNGAIVLAAYFLWEYAVSKMGTAASIKAAADHLISQASKYPWRRKNTAYNEPYSEVQRLYDLVKSAERVTRILLGRHSVAELNGLISPPPNKYCHQYAAFASIVQIVSISESFLTQPMLLTITEVDSIICDRGSASSILLVMTWKFAIKVFASVESEAHPYQAFQATCEFIDALSHMSENFILIYCRVLLPTLRRALIVLPPGPAQRAVLSVIKSLCYHGRIAFGPTNHLFYDPSPGIWAINPTLDFIRSSIL